MKARKLSLVCAVIFLIFNLDSCKSSPTDPTPPSTKCTLTVNVSPSGGGTVAKSPNQSQYASGTTVTVTATPAAGYTFTRWEGDVTGTTNPTSVTMNGNKSITAIFTGGPPSYIMQITVSPSGSGMVDRSPNQSTYAAGTAVTLTATPTAGYTFTRWEGDVTGTANPTTVTMNASKALTAVFTVTTPQYTLAVTASPSNGGTVTRSPEQAFYDSGTVVTLTATPAAGSGYTFTRWEGDVTGTTNPTTVTMNANKALTAVFTKPSSQYTLTVNVVPALWGSVTKSPDQTLYAPGTVVTLTASGAMGHGFVNWEGDATGNANPIMVTMDRDKTVTANFILQTTYYRLTVASSPSNGGSVTKNPDSAQYYRGATVVLTATPAPGYLFTGWQGDATGSANPTTITMNGDRTVTAVFSAEPPRIQLATAYLTFSATVGGSSPPVQTVNITNSGGGTLSGLASSISYSAGQTGWLTATLGGTTAPATLSVTANLGSLTAGTYNATISITSGVASNSPQPIGVTFTVLPAVAQYVLSTSVSPMNGGTVAKSPNQSQYPSGTLVMLTATPTSGYSFTRWEGDVTGTANPTNIMMNANKSATAVFTQGPQILNAYATYDNVIMKSSNNSSLETSVFQNSSSGVGYDIAANGPVWDYLATASVLKFNVQSQIQGRTISKATLRFYVYALRGDLSVTPTMRLAAFANDWSPSTITWNTFMTLSYITESAIQVYAPSSPAVVPFDFDVTTTVQHWASGTWPNYGFELVPLEPAYPGYSSLQTTYFQSLEFYNNSNQRPQLIIEFQ